MSLSPDVPAVLNRLPGLSVPYVWKEGDTWRMLAQMQGGDFRQTAVQLTSEDGVNWSDAQRLQGVTQDCESPVAARFGDGYVLVCSVRTQSRADVRALPEVPDTL